CNQDDRAATDDQRQRRGAKGHSEIFGPPPDSCKEGVPPISIPPYGRPRDGPSGTVADPGGRLLSRTASTPTPSRSKVRRQERLTSWRRRAEQGPNRRTTRRPCGRVRVA